MAGVYGSGKNLLCDQKAERSVTSGTFINSGLPGTVIMEECRFRIWSAAPFHARFQNRGFPARQPFHCLLCLGRLEGQKAGVYHPNRAGQTIYPESVLSTGAIPLTGGEWLIFFFYRQ